MGQIQNMDQVREEVECIRGWVTRIRMSVADGAPDTIVVPRTEYWMSGGGTTTPASARDEVPRLHSGHGLRSSHETPPDGVDPARGLARSFRDDLGLAEQ